MAKTRLDIARQLLERLTRGPAIGFRGNDAITHAEAEQRFRGWAHTWIIDDLVALLPELRNHPPIVVPMPDGTAKHMTIAEYFDAFFRLPQNDIDGRNAMVYALKQCDQRNAELRKAKNL